MSRNTAPHTALRVDVLGVSSPLRHLRQFSPFTYSTFPAYFLLIQLKPKHSRLDVLTIFQRGVCGVRGAHGAVFRDTRQD